jgi:hypothetical protein
MSGGLPLKMIKVIAFFIATVSMNVHSSTEDEINYLLNFVSTTDCKYERNGTMYNGVKAAAHIKRKYNYYLDDIKTTEDFIKLSATKSTMSGKYYKIHCQNKIAIKSQDWLLKALTSYRKKNS